MRTTTSSTLLNGLRDATNRTVWQEYVDRYRPLLIGYARRLGLPEDDAEDAAQETLVSFSNAYREGKYARQKGRLRGWLYGIARHQILAALRRRGGRERADAETVLKRVEAHDDLEELWNKEWREAVLRRCTDEVRREVEPKTFQAFELFVLKGHSAEKVAEQLNTTANAVFCAKRRVLARVRELFPVLEEIW